MQALDVLGSNIICTSVRDVAVWGVEDGAMFQGMAIGDGILDYPLYSKKSAELCPPSAECRSTGGRFRPHKPSDLPRQSCTG